MSSRSLRRSVAILGFAALLAPAASLQAAPGRPALPAAPAATPSAPRHNPLIEFLLHLITGAGAGIDAGVSSDGNG